MQMAESDPPTISLLISAYDQIEHTKRCLQHLNKTLQRKIHYEVLVIDDGSTDGTQAWLRSLKDPCKVFFNRKNVGFAKSNNVLAAEAKGEFLCFLNNDVFVEGDWLLPLLEVFRKKKKVGMVGNVQKIWNSSRYDHMGVVFAPEGNPRHFGQGFWHRPFKGEVRSWSAVTAACCVTRRELFLELGGFDEIFLNGCEDIDLCLRMNQSGLSNFVVHDSVVRHVKGASEGRKKFNDRNASLLADRWKRLIQTNQSIRDQKLHAYTYFHRGLSRPWSIHFGKWIDSMRILIGIREL